MFVCVFFFQKKKKSFRNCVLKREGIKAACVFRSMGRTAQRGPCKFESQSFRRGKPRFMRRADLEDSGLLKDDTLIVRCDVSVVVQNLLGDEDRVDVTIPKPHLGQDLRGLLQGDDYTDVVFDVKVINRMLNNALKGSDSLSSKSSVLHLLKILACGFYLQGTMIRAHKMILSVRSPMLRATFGTEMTRGREDGVVKVDDIEPEVFKAMLEFIYSDDLDFYSDEDDDQV